MATLRCGEGVLRLYDGTRVSDLEFSDVFVGTEVASVFTILNTQSMVFVVNTNRVYVGQISQFNRVAVALDFPATADTGRLIVEYWNGPTWVSVSNLADGTAVGNNTMRQDGFIYLDVHPSDWVRCPPGDLFHVRMRTTKTPAVAPVVRLFQPTSGQFI